ncbi:MAG: hypothetical protein H6633_16695 [Anaerolineales bacterium]|nr:hypothetical protein [Anaerolineales bacterium]
MFYLLPLEDVENDPASALTLSQTTIDLCLTALIRAQYPDNWRYDLDPLTDPEWLTAEGFLTTAILELTQPDGVIDGGSA